MSCGFESYIGLKNTTILPQERVMANDRDVTVIVEFGKVDGMPNYNYAGLLHNILMIRTSFIFVAYV